jgi:hypothetical protein
MSKAQLIFGLSSGLLLGGAGASAWQAGLIGPSLLLVGLGLCSINGAAYIKGTLRSAKPARQNLFNQHLVSASSQSGK